MVFCGQSLYGQEPGIVAAKPTDGISVEIEGGFMVPYVATIPGTDVQFEMIPVPGGTFKLGSDASEEGRGEDEGPQVEITLQPYWVGKTEVTWAEYKRFMGMYKIFKNLQSQRIRRVDASNRADAITVPTPLYEPSHTFEYGEDPQQPAVTMTQYAAKQYSKWVSGLTGQQYRLPTEAEWEYAAEAGNGGPYSFGDDTSALAEYASFADTNSTGASKVGSKKPNAFGLHDMHGNVWEWTVDGYSSSGFGDLTPGPKTPFESANWPKSPYPRTVRGGGWQDGAERCRSAARMGSDDEEWKSEDPNVPLSPWWYTTDPARSVGFRLVRSAKPLSKEDIQKFWGIDHEDIELDVQARLDEGRGAIGLPVPELADELKKNK